MKSIRLHSYIPSLFILSSFGPYVFVSLGLRVEQLVIYMIFPFAIMTLFLRKNECGFFSPNVAIMFLLFFATIWSLFVTVLRTPYYPSLFELIAAIESYVQPIAIMFILSVYVRPDTVCSAKHNLISSCNLLILLLLLNCGLAILMTFMNLDESVSHYFWRGTGEAFSAVGSRAMANGRFCGVFSQPMEAGLTYSLGLLLWAYKRRIKNGKLSPFDLLSLIGIIIGGVLTVSKVFVICGSLIFVLYYLNLKMLRSFFSIRNAITFTSVILLATVFMTKWSGFNYFLRLFDLRSKGLGEIIHLLTAGRFGGGDENVGTRIVEVLKESPLCGFGFASAPAVDSAYFQFLVQGGLVALFSYFIILMIIGWPGLKNFIFHRTEERRLLFHVFILVVVAGVGAPVLTINRFSTIFWVFFYLVFMTDRLKSRVKKINCNNGHVLCNN